MSELNSGRAKAWSIIYSNSSSTTNPPTPIISEAAGDVNKEGPWKSLGSSMNAISFGFVATAILISMFLIMAIFEHLFRPNDSPSSSSHDHSRSTQMHKLNGSPQLVSCFSHAYLSCVCFKLLLMSQVESDSRYRRRTQGISRW